MSARFELFESSDLFDHATKIRIELHKMRGQIGLDFEVSGSIWPLTDEERAEEEERGNPAPDPTAVARALLTAFLCSEKGGRS